LPGIGGREELTGRPQRIFRAAEATLDDTIKMDACHFMFFKTHKIFSTKSDSSYQLLTLGDNDMLM
jgi:hypothetical protein